MQDNGKQKVVVGVDGSACGQEALRWAQRYVADVGGHLTAVIAWHHPALTTTGGGVAPNTPDPERHARTVLTASVERASSEGASDVDQIVAQGHPAGVLIDRSQDADLLVVGTRGHGGFAGMLLGSVSTHCVQHARCPVVVVRS
jgi:nucleotide-binding universal stress UspA family protein